MMHSSSGFGKKLCECALASPKGHRDALWSGSPSLCSLFSVHFDCNLSEVIISLVTVIIDSFIEN